MAIVYNLVTYLQTWPQNLKAAKAYAVQYGSYKRLTIELSSRDPDQTEIADTLEEAKSLPKKQPRE